MAAEPALPRIPTILVCGGSAEAREAFILNDLQSQADQDGANAAAFLEGLPSGRSGLDDLRSIQVRRSAPGCLCCTGNLVLRVTLNRMLRERPTRLYIGVTAGTHLDQLLTMLSAPPYCEWLHLAQTVSL